MGKVVLLIFLFTANGNAEITKISGFNSLAVCEVQATKLTHDIVVSNVYRGFVTSRCIEREFTKKTK